jgi:F0F1-type ATP synthase membrane subunit c/vacuolar-type H+-ATPase subunit K
VDKLRAAYRVAVIIGLAIMASLVIYLIIVQLFENGSFGQAGGQSLQGPQLEIIKFILLGVSVVNFFLIRFLNNLILNPAGEQRPAPTAAAPSDLGKLTTAAIVTFALCETPAIFGLVLYFLGRNATDFYLFLLISMFFFASHFPKYSQWEEWYRKQQPGQGMRRP